MNDYRDVLEHQYAQRCRHNPDYSQRAFARELGLSASQLSEVMKGVHGLSPARARAIAERLRMDETATERFVDLVEAKHARDPRRRQQAQERLEARRDHESFDMLPSDAFQMIAEWYHLALLELLKTRHFRSDAGWIAKALRIPVETAVGAVSRLRRLGLVRTDGGRIRAMKAKVSTTFDVPSQAIRTFHSQVLDKAKDALPHQSVDEREFGALLVPVGKHQIPEAKRLIREFQDRFSEELGADLVKDEVYALSVQFFRLSDASRGAPGTSADPKP